MKNKMKKALFLKIGDYVLKKPLEFSFDSSKLNKKDEEVIVITLPADNCLVTALCSIQLNRIETPLAVIEVDERKITCIVKSYSYDIIFEETEEEHDFFTFRLKLPCYSG